MTELGNAPKETHLEQGVGAKPQVSFLSGVGWRVASEWPRVAVSGSYQSLGLL